jgi:hypothetical protein
MNVQADHFDKKIIPNAKCAIVNLTQEGYEHSNLYSLYSPSSLVRANYDNWACYGDNYAEYEK